MTTLTGDRCSLIALLVCLACSALGAEPKPARRALSVPEVDHSPFSVGPDWTRPDPGSVAEFTVRGGIDGIPECVFRWCAGGPEEDLLVLRAPTELDVIVEGHVRRLPGGAGFLYEYWVTSSIRSKQNLRHFIVEVSGALEHVGSPGEGWDSMQYSGDWRQLGTMEALKWNSALVDPKSRVAPGSRIGPFSFQSHLPPGVVKCFVRGYVPIPRSTRGGEVPPDVLEAAYNILRSALFGRTVGPIRYPEDRPGRLEAAVDAAEEAVRLGWVSPVSGQEVLSHLRKASECLRKGDDKGTHQALAALQARLDSMRAEGALLEEAYAILKLNIEHLEEMLKQQ